MDELTNETNEIPVESPVENTEENTRPVNPRRKKKSQLQIFKEAYLPAVIAGVALLLILIFVIGSITRAVKKHKVEKDASIAASSSVAAQEAAWQAEADKLLAQAAEQAAGYDYVGAIDTIDSFSGDISAYEDLMNKRTEYVNAQSQMTEWSDPSDVTNLSFQMLVADSARAYADEDYGSAYESNFITTTEFQKILEQLYANGYMLVSYDNFITTTTNADGTVSYTSRSLYLPSGKKPLMITQTNVNYCLYMVDGDDDGYADKDGAGFASRLVVGADGKITCEMVDAEGNTVTGAYDLVPILDAFIEAHPDFSFGGAKATLAVTGYNGLFGYRTDSDSKERLTAEEYNAELQGAAAIINALRADGYTFACYTYSNIGYGDEELTAIQEDLASWNSEVTPLLGQTDILVYAMNSDIGDTGAYSGDKFNALRSAGFKYFIGFCTSGDRWVNIETDYIRQGRIMVTGSNLEDNATWFSGMFDAASVLDSTRDSE